MRLELACWTEMATAGEVVVWDCTLYLRLKNGLKIDLVMFTIEIELAIF